MHPSQVFSKTQSKKATQKPSKPRPIDVITPSRLGSIRIPRSLRTILLDFTLCFLIECPGDVIKFGSKYFKSITLRKKLLKKYGQIFDDSYSDNSSERKKLTKTKGCKRCKKTLRMCNECKKVHKLCYSCKKEMKMSPYCAMSQRSALRRISEDRDVPPEMLQKRRESVYAEGLNEEETVRWSPPVYDKSSEQKKKLRSTLRDKTLFKELLPDEINTIIDAMFLREVEADEVVIRQGRGGDFYYIIESGQYRAYTKGEEGNTKILTNYYGEGSFGELALMYNVPRYCSVKALTKGKLWVLDRDTFRKIVIIGAVVNREYNMKLLRSVPTLSTLTEAEMLNLADSLDVQHFQSGDKIIRQGEEATGMFFIHQGHVTVSYKDEYGLEVVLDSLESGAYFGEIALLENVQRQASVTANSQVTVAFLNRDAFERLLGSCVEIMNRKLEHYEKQKDGALLQASQLRIVSESSIASE